MANYIVDPALLKKFMPYKTEPDTFMGNTYLSLVGFMFNNTRVLGMQVPFHVNFEEVNLRFYVKYNDHGNWKRGVVFIKEIVPKPAVSFVANNLFHENYESMPMKHFSKETGDSFEFGYSWKHRNKWNRLEAITEKVALPKLHNSEVHFITEHYWGYSKYDAHTTYEYEVKHEQWKIYPVKEYTIDCDFLGVYGTEFAFLENMAASSVFVAKGSDITVMSKRKI